MSKYNALKKRLQNSANYIFEKSKVNFVVSLSKALKDKKMTQEALAKKMGVSAAAVSKIMRADQNLTISTMSKIAYALDMDFTVELRDKAARPLVVEKVSVQLQSCTPSDYRSYSSAKHAVRSIRYEPSGLPEHHSHDQTSQYESAAA